MTGKKRPRALSRSENMSRIKAEDTSPELTIRKGLWAAGYRYRLHFKTPGGKADLVIPSIKFALFIDGCFWHGCPEHYVRPRTKHEFWDAKLTENTTRDRKQTLALEAEGWLVLRVWEHEVVENPGTVLDHSITVPDVYDFYMVNTPCRQGVPTPTHISVLFNNIPECKPE